MDGAFGFVSGKSLPRSRLRFTMFSGNFIVLHFTFRSVIHFELIFVKYVFYVCSSFFFFACRYSLVSSSFVEDTIFVPSCCLCSFVKDQLATFRGVYFWALCPALLICLSVLLPVTHGFDYCIFIVSLEVDVSLFPFYSSLSVLC